MRRATWVGLCVGIVIVSALLLLSWVFSIYNRIVTLSEEVKENWSQVENQYQRRYDLIPNLVSATKGYLKHEREIFTHIADARARLLSATTPAEKIKAATLVETFLGRLLMIVENYPLLRASEPVRGLMDELAGTENRLSVARYRYNSAVKAYNTFIKRFPAKIFAEYMGFKPQTYFEVPKPVRVAPRVEL